MFCHLVAGSGNNETSGGRDIKRVLAVAASTDYINISVCLQDGWYTSFEDTIAESKEFIYCNTTHLQTCEQCGNLFVGVFTLCDANQD